MGAEPDHAPADVVIEHVTGVIAEDTEDGRLRLVRIDAVIIGPRSIARPEALVRAPAEGYSRSSSAAAARSDAMPRWR